MEGGWARSLEIVVLVGFGFLVEWLAPAPWVWLPRIAIVAWFASMLWRFRRA